MPVGPIVVLIGPPGAGKSRIGRKVATYLDAEFIDTDDRITSEHGSIAELFQNQGEPAFRAIERDVVAEALTELAVVSLGGGAVMDADTRRRLSGHRVALLTVSPEAVSKRIGGGHRPLLANSTASEQLDAWRSIVDARRETYEALAKRSWDTSTRTIAQIAREIADWAQEDRAGNTES